MSSKKPTKTSPNNRVTTRALLNNKTKSPNANMDGKVAKVMNSHTKLNKKLEALLKKPRKKD